QALATTVQQATAALLHRNVVLPKSLPASQLLAPQLPTEEEASPPVSAAAAEPAQLAPVLLHEDPDDDGATTEATSSYSPEQSDSGSSTLPAPCETRPSTPRDLGSSPGSTVTGKATPPPLLRLPTITDAAAHTFTLPGTVTFHVPVLELPAATSPINES